MAANRNALRDAPRAGRARARSRSRIDNAGRIFGSTADASAKEPVWWGATGDAHVIPTTPAAEPTGFQRVSPAGVAVGFGGPSPSGPFIAASPAYVPTSVGSGADNADLVSDAGHYVLRTAGGYVFHGGGAPVTLTFHTRRAQRGRRDRRQGGVRPGGPPRERHGGAVAAPGRRDPAGGLRRQVHQQPRPDRAATSVRCACPRPSCGSCASRARTVSARSRRRTASSAADRSPRRHDAPRGGAARMCPYRTQDCGTPLGAWHR